MKTVRGWLGNAALVLLAALALAWLLVTLAIAAPFLLFVAVWCGFGMANPWRRDV